MRLEAIRTHDARFASLPGRPCAPRRVSDLPGYEGMRMHYVDEDPRHARCSSSFTVSPHGVSRLARSRGQPWPRHRPSDETFVAPSDRRRERGLRRTLSRARIQHWGPYLPRLDPDVTGRRRGGGVPGARRKAGHRIQRSVVHGDRRDRPGASTCHAAVSWGHRWLSTANCAPACRALPPGVGDEFARAALPGWEG